MVEARPFYLPSAMWKFVLFITYILIFIKFSGAYVFPSWRTKSAVSYSDIQLLAKKVKESYGNTIDEPEASKVFFEHLQKALTNTRMDSDAAISRKLSNQRVDRVHDSLNELRQVASTLEEQGSPKRAQKRSKISPSGLEERLSEASRNEIDDFASMKSPEPASYSLSDSTDLRGLTSDMMVGLVEDPVKSAALIVRDVERQASAAASEGFDLDLGLSSETTDLYSADNSAKKAKLRLYKMIDEGMPVFDGPPCPVCGSPATAEELFDWGKCEICRQGELTEPDVSLEQRYKIREAKEKMIRLNSTKSGDSVALLSAQPQTPQAGATAVAPSIAAVPAPAVAVVAAVPAATSITAAAAPAVASQQTQTPSKAKAQIAEVKANANVGAQTNVKQQAAKATAKSATTASTSVQTSGTMVRSVTPSSSSSTVSSSSSSSNNNSNSSRNNSGKKAPAIDEGLKKKEEKEVEEKVEKEVEEIADEFDVYDQNQNYEDEYNYDRQTYCKFREVGESLSTEHFSKKDIIEGIGRLRGEMDNLEGIDLTMNNMKKVIEVCLEDIARLKEENKLLRAGHEYLLGKINRIDLNPNPNPDLKPSPQSSQIARLLPHSNASTKTKNNINAGSGDAATAPPRYVLSRSRRAINITKRKSSRPAAASTVSTGASNNYIDTTIDTTTTNSNSSSDPDENTIPEVNLKRGLERIKGLEG